MSCAIAFNLTHWTFEILTEVAQFIVFFTFLTDCQLYVCLQDTRSSSINIRILSPHSLISNEVNDYLLLAVLLGFYSETWPIQEKLLGDTDAMLDLPILSFEVSKDGRKL